MEILLRPGWLGLLFSGWRAGWRDCIAGRPSGQTARASRPPAVMRSAAGILRIRAGRVLDVSGLGPAWSCVPVKTGGNPPVLAFSGGSRRRDAAVFAAWRGRRFPWFRMLSDGLGAWFPGLPSGPPEGPGLPRFRGVSTGVAAGPLGGPPGCLESWPGGRLFCPFCPAFSGPEGVAGGPGRGEKLPDREKRTCVKKVRGGIQLRVVGFTRSALCNERSFRTDVSICTIYRYGSARAGV